MPDFFGALAIPLAIYVTGFLLVFKLAITEWGPRSKRGFLSVLIICIGNAIFWPFVAYDAVAKWFRTLPEDFNA